MARSRSSTGRIALVAAGLALQALAGCTPNSAQELRADEHRLGAANAPLIVVEYGDFQCSVCRRFAAETFPAIEAEYIATGKVAWVWRQFPLRAVHPDAERAAQASECAASQGKFWEYAAVLLGAEAPLDAASLRGYAQSLGLDLVQFDACTGAAAAAERVQADIALGGASGVHFTPTLFINGSAAVGFVSADELRVILDRALAQATAGF